MCFLGDRKALLLTFTSFNHCRLNTVQVFSVKNAFPNIYYLISLIESQGSATLIPECVLLGLQAVGSCWNHVQHVRGS